MLFSPYPRHDVPKNDRQKVDAMIDVLPTRRFQTDMDLSDLKARDLKDQLRSRGVSCIGMTEKAELIAAIKARRERSCPICANDFVPDEAYKRTLCGHGFHEHCLRSSAMHEYDATSGLPRCPTCREALNRTPLTVKIAIGEETCEDKQSHLRECKRKRNPVAARRTHTTITANKQCATQ